MTKLTDEQEAALLAEFEKMLGEEDDDSEENDFGYFDPNIFSYPDDLDLEYPDEPPAIPKEALKKEEDKCKHKETKKVYITNMKAYIMCKDCKADLGDAE